MIAISEKEDFEHELLNCGYKVSGMFKCGHHKSFAAVFGCEDAAQQVLMSVCPCVCRQFTFHKCNPVITRHYKSVQDSTKQYKTVQNSTRRYKTVQDSTRKEIQFNAKNSV